MIRVSLWKEVELHRPRPLPVATNKAVKPTVAASCPMIFWAHQADDSSLLRPIGQPQGDPMTEKGFSCPDKVGSQEALYIDIYSTHQKYILLVGFSLHHQIIRRTMYLQPTVNGITIIYHI